jgi:hypothetical protein
MTEYLRLLNNARYFSKENPNMLRKNNRAVFGSY